MKTNNEPADSSTAKRATCTSLIYIVFLSLMLLIMMASCASTTIESDVTPAKENPSGLDGDDLMVTLSAPEAYAFPSTRADGNLHAGHYLRYIATLYEYKNAQLSIDKNNPNPIRHQEVLAGTQEGGDKIVFKNVDPGYYFIVVSADYITNNTVGSDGRYEDKYYDTKSNPIAISLKTPVDASTFFNNHNYDLFTMTPYDLTEIKESSKGYFEKKKGEPVEFNFKLKRRVSRIEVIAEGTGTFDALKDITISKYSRLNNLNRVGGNAPDEESVSTPITLTPYDATSRLLFFYYTLSNEDKDKVLRDITFTLNPVEGYEFGKAEHTVKWGVISPSPNTIFKVKGDFLNTTKAPSNSTQIKVTTNENWNEETINPKP